MMLLPLLLSKKLYFCFVSKNHSFPQESQKPCTEKVFFAGYCKSSIRFVLVNSPAVIR
jgi:hypothetical protein